jgi:hypothetical protein
MKYICLGYFDEKKWEAMSEREQHTFMDDCFAYDDLLRKNGHIVGGEALQSARNATTLGWKSGKVSVTDGPYAETKEQLGSIRRVRSDRPETCDSVDVKKPGCEVENRRNSLAENLAELIRENEGRRATFLAVYETREQIAGYFLIHAKDRDETIGLTQRSAEGGKCGLTFGGGAIF